MDTFDRILITVLIIALGIGLIQTIVQVGKMKRQNLEFDTRLVKLENLLLDNQKRSL